ncbi:MAG: D-alanyl-D-alanine carboxypeptidase [Tissierellia bacterium]|nr:D-alanyl-D-alanine carboxypeptidase [Tissierellia bacterium]
MKRIIIWIVLISILSLFITPFSFAEGELNIKAKSAILMDYNTRKVIYEQNAHERVAPASITKIMTLLLAMEALESGKISLNDEVRISAHAAGMGGSQLWLEEGEIQRVEDLIKAVAIRSANDASVALAEYIAGSEELFVKMMNEKARELGMNNTNFANASGLPNENHYTSAYDVGIMSAELLKHEGIHKWLITYMDEMLVGKNKDKVQSLVNTNRLIKEYEGTTGIKTGSTTEAGHCLSASAKRNNLHLIAVVMGSETSKIRFDETMRLLDYGFANYDSVPVGRKGDVIGKVNVNKGKIDYVEAVLERDSFLLLPKGESGNITKEIVLLDFVEGPIEKGQELGKLIVKIDGVEADTIKLVSNISVEKASFKDLLLKTIRKFILG